MRILLSIVFMSICYVSFAQTDLMTIKISPSFIKGAQFTISKADTGYSMSLKGVLFNETVLIKESSLSKIKNFMPEYFIGKQLEDSIECAKQLEDEKNGIYIVGLDGINIEGIFRDQDSNRMFQFWSPNQASVNHKLMILLFDLMKGSFVKPETQEYITELKLYFRI